MRCILILLYGLVWAGAKGQQKVNTFQVIDSLTRKAIPSVSITIVRAKLAISTEKDGVFSIPGNLSKMRDTLIVEAQGYMAHKVLLHKLQGMDSLRLVRSQRRIQGIPSDYRQEIELNQFEKFDVTHYAGLHTETSSFDYLQLAQQFYLPKPGGQLMKIYVSRLAFRLNNLRQEDAVGMEPTKFRLRIYEADTIKGGPGEELCEQVIEVRDKDSQYLEINLSNYKIIIPRNSFFVAIEWIRDFTNQGYVLVQEKSVRPVQTINYRPAVGVSPVKGTNLNIWGLNLKKQWKPYTYFSPDFTDLAITAVVRQ
ncbi:hypothetical protein [Pedobacter sp. JCM 36344]|uniref:hypothetical protein n=1 Tax=Pedobacter sp. JCM 36344 TaxID=3374280 RepID=UPI00397BBD35